MSAKFARQAAFWGIGCREAVGGGKPVCSSLAYFCTGVWRTSASAILAGGRP